MEHYKKSLNHIVWADQTYDEYKYLVSSLITTIESQNSQIESLKAITELAVKGLKEISSKRPVNCDWETDDYYEKYCECEDISTSTISEIARLSHDSTS